MLSGNKSIRLTFIDSKNDRIVQRDAIAVMWNTNHTFLQGFMRSKHLRGKIIRWTKKVVRAPKMLFPYIASSSFIKDQSLKNGAAAYARNV